MVKRGYSGLLAVSILSMLALAAGAQHRSSAAVQGDYTGILEGSRGTLHVKLHLKVSVSGLFSGSVDSPDQGATGIPCTEIHFDGQALSFAVPTVHSSWQGFLSLDGGTLSGTWTQGGPLPLNFVRDAIAAAVRVPTTEPTVDWRPSVAEDNKAATLLDTLSFMVNTLQYKGMGDGIPPKANECLLSLGATDNSGQETIDLKHVDPLSIGVRGSTVSLSGSNNGPYGARCQLSATTCTSENAPRLVTATYLSFDTNETAKRVARAFMHAALLCGGSKAVSPF